MRRDQDVAAQRRRVGGDERAFLFALDVAGEQHAAAAARDAQHARHRVRLQRPGVVGAAGCSTANVDAVPDPALAGDAAARRLRAARAADGPARASSASASTSSAPRTLRAPPTWSLSRWLSISRSRCSSPRPRKSGTRTRWPASLSARVLRPGVEQEHVSARAHQHGGALADVGGDEVEAALRRDRDGGTSSASASGIASSRARQRHRQRPRARRRAGRRAAPMAARPAPSRRAPGRAASAAQVRLERLHEHGSRATRAARARRRAARAA